jgi:membrane fusion protein, copper/silver efflux system
MLTHTLLIMKLTVITILFCAILAAGCGDSDHHLPDQSLPASTDTAVLYDSPESFKTSYSTALEAYFDLKDALVQSDADAAAEKASALAAAVEDVEHSGLEGEAHNMWMSHQVVKLAEAGRIAGEQDIEEQRVRFDPLSESFIETVKSFRPAGYTVYEQMCPMVRGGSASWLSKEEQIANPYHGDRMMRCGSVVARI